MGTPDPGWKAYYSRAVGDGSHMARKLLCWADVGPSGRWHPVHRKQHAYTG
jgi:hypothetical protein